jgi:hypothetical protein
MGRNVRHGGVGMGRRGGGVHAGAHEGCRKGRRAAHAGAWGWGERNNRRRMRAHAGALASWARSPEWCSLQIADGIIGLRAGAGAEGQAVGAREAAAGRRTAAAQGGGGGGAGAAFALGLAAGVKVGAHSSGFRHTCRSGGGGEGGIAKREKKSKYCDTQAPAVDQGATAQLCRPCGRHGESAAFRKRCNMHDTLRVQCPAAGVPRRRPARGAKSRCQICR